MDNELPSVIPPEQPSLAELEPLSGTTPLPVPAALSAPVPTTPAYRDRSTGLVIFGVVQIILGLLAGLMVPLAALGAFLSRLAPGGGMKPAQYLSGIATYAFTAAALLTLGIGSVQMRRWARALTVVISWYWLITGILITILLTAVLPVTMRSVMQAQQKAAGHSQAVSEGVMAFILTIVIVLGAVFLVVVPIAFIVFYSRHDVADTCRYRDPVERWTDRVPLPVLGACVVMVVQLAYMLVTGVSTPLFPFFGRYLTGVPATACFLLVGCLDGYLAFAFYRLQPAGWWIAMIAAPIRLFSMAFTYARADLMQAYSKLGFSDAQMQMLNSSPFFRSHVILWWSLISAVLFFGYLVWLKRYFKTPGTPQQQEAFQAHVG